ncbi:MAG: NUDIX domain-containing protein [candidate division KSB1 bacterium]|nr:NUDIX domain-containing protein [candidate division KSB1 bacterium]MDZ7342664.1 NUDIX domain-containing protein [candidate division KSB1 bacterium]
MISDRIRPVALCVFRHKNRILVFEGHDRSKNQIFYRPLGGSIEFGEHSSATIRREIREELGAEICHVVFLGSLEIIYTYNGQPGHELVQVYEADFVDPNFYERQSFDAVEDDGLPMTVLWKELDHFKAGKAILYPTGLLELLG